MNRYVRPLILSLLIAVLGCGQTNAPPTSGETPSNASTTNSSEGSESNSASAPSNKVNGENGHTEPAPTSAPVATAIDGTSNVEAEPEAPTSDATSGETASTTEEKEIATIVSDAPTRKLRVATFNCSLYRKRLGELSKDLASGENDDAHRIAHIIQTIRPDVLLLNEFDYDPELASITSFRELYLSIGHDKAQPIDYPHVYTSSVNTGEPSGVDLDNDGSTDGWNDSFGFGRYPGQYGMVVLSRYPIDTQQTRTFQKLLWKDMHAANIPTDPSSGKNFYSDEAMDVFRISSKSHWDVAINVDNSTLHFLVSHPTPPVFDGPEDRNGKRNHDEIRLLADYISGDPHGYIKDDVGKQGGLASESHFVIAGDLNADPNDGASYQYAIRQLTEHPLVHSSPTPQSEGALEQANQGANKEHVSDPKFDTADFDDRRTGNLRADYVLASKTVNLVDCGVFWPKSGEAGHELVSVSDHRLVWIDIELP